ncbi:MAG: APC family permease [Nocardioidaceae bacterium]
MSHKVALRRELRTIESLALSIAMMSPALAMSLYGGAPAMYVGYGAPLAFVFAGVGVVLVGGGLIYLCRYFSHAGSVYGLTGATLGPRAGFVSGWALLGCYLVYTAASAATAGYFATLFLKDTGIAPHADFVWFTLGFLVIAYFLASLDIKRVGQTLLTIEGVSILMMLIVLVIVVGKLLGGFQGHHVTARVFTLPDGVSFHNLVLASVFAFTAFAGFEGAASLGEETENPRRAIPKALTIAIVAGVLFYIAVVAVMSMGFGTADGGSHFAGSSGPLFDLSRSYVGSTMAEVLEIGGLISAFSAALATMVGGGRMVFALVRDAAPASSLGKVNENGVPINGVRIMLGFAVLAVVVVRLTGATGLDTAFYLGTIGTLAVLVAYAMVDVGAFRLMSKTVKRKGVALIPLLGTFFLCYVMWNEVHPRPPAPYSYFPYVVAAWLLIAVVLSFASPGLAARIGAGLTEEEGLTSLPAGRDNLPVAGDPL